MSFGRSGDIDVKWGATPTVSLDMEFHHMQVSVYFRLLLEALQAGIEIDYISFEAGSADPDENTLRAGRGHRQCAAGADLRRALFTRRGPARLGCRPEEHANDKLCRRQSRRARITIAMRAARRAIRAR